MRLIDPLSMSRSPGEQIALAWYSHLESEMVEGGFSPPERRMMLDPMFYYGRVLESGTRDYSMASIGRNVGRALDFLAPFGPTSPPRLLDLGCGLGMQSLLFAALGARVVGVDLNPRAIALCEKRRAFFETRLGRRLNIDFLEGSFPAVASTFAGDSFDLGFSYSAMVHMLPFDATMNALGGLIRPGGRFFLWDVNARTLRWKGVAYASTLSSPWSIRDEFERNGFTVREFRSGVTIPRQLWRIPWTQPLWRRIDNLAPVTLAASFVLAGEKHRD